MERETGYNIDTIYRLIQRMDKVHNVIRYDEQSKEILLINWSKYNWSSSEKVAKAIEGVAKHIKSEKFKTIIYDLMNNNINTKNISDNRTETDTVSDTDVSIPYPYGMDTVSSKPKAKRFIKPTVEDVKAYCQERNNNVNAEKFIDYYESNGWKVGKNPMKDWKAAVRSWERNGYSNTSSEKYTNGDSIDKYKAVINKF